MVDLTRFNEEQLEKLFEKAYNKFKKFSDLLDSEFENSDQETITSNFILETLSKFEDSYERDKVSIAPAYRNTYSLHLSNIINKYLINSDLFQDSHTKKPMFGGCVVDKDKSLISHRFSSIDDFNSIIDVHTKGLSHNRVLLDDYSPCKNQSLYLIENGVQKSNLNMDCYSIIECNDFKDFSHTCMENYNTIV
ncbi:hypothetical protein [Methanolobus sp. WCC4]|uniref:hypothetical protein n=1 Tax=Methanolobus sp. WCC4 TaxID=3125784 RepID=UPI0030FC0105